MAAICWKNDRKKFLLWMLLTVQSQQWQSADSWRRTDTVPEITRIAVKYIKCYWICRTVIKLNLKDQTYECIYSHVHEVYDKVSASASYGEFVKKYTEQYVHEQDRQKLQEFLASEKLTEHLVDGCMEEDMSYRRICDNEADSYIWMEAKRYVDETENTAILTFHNAKVIPDTIVNMEQELRKKEKNITKQYWDMVSLLVAVLNHNNLVETEHQDDISFYTEQVYRQLQKNYPEYGITEEEIENVSHLAPIHDIGKIRVSIEILNKNGKLTIDEMEVVKQHPICRKKKKTWYDSKTAC